MKRDIETRLRKLEACHLPSSLKPLHYVCCPTLDDCEAQQRAMIEAAAAAESDDFIFVYGVKPMPQVI
jgi:hypothetical protein